MFASANIFNKASEFEFAAHGAKKPPSLLGGPGGAGGI